MAKKRRAAKRRTKRDVRHTLAAYSKAATAVLALGGGATLSLPEASEAAVVGPIPVGITLQAPPITWTTWYYPSWTYTWANTTLDLNNDGSDDVVFSHARSSWMGSWTHSSYGWGYSYWNSGRWNGAFAQALNGGIIGNGAASAFVTSANLNGAMSQSTWGFLGAYVSTTGSWHTYAAPPGYSSWISSTGPWSWTTYWGNFPGQGPRYIGIVFNAADGPHYGWIRVIVPRNVDFITIIDYAYESTPNTPIHVGFGAAPVGGVVHDVSDVAEQEGNQ